MTPVDCHENHGELVICEALNQGIRGDFRLTFQSLAHRSQIYHGEVVVHDLCSPDNTLDGHIQLMWRGATWTTWEYCASTHSVDNKKRWDTQSLLGWE